mgnify:CR=1 FL=1
MNNSKAGFGWLLKMAWRDGKASGKRLLLFMASIILGIAAVVSIQSFSKNLSENISLQSKALMGADYLIDTPLEVLEEDLCPKNWYRISRKFIVPLASVKEILVYSNSRLKIILPTFKGEDVIVSREKVSDFKNWMA